MSIMPCRCSCCQKQKEVPDLESIRRQFERITTPPKPPSVTPFDMDKVKKRAKEGGHYSRWLYVGELINEIHRLHTEVDKYRQELYKRDHDKA